MYCDDKSGLKRIDPEVYSIIKKEIERERNRINLIASENYAPLPILEAQASILTNKYAEGYPGARYYPGCEPSDMVEKIAIERANALFGSEHANVQPHSGTQANMAVYMCALSPGDLIMAMDLTCGGHLSHGAHYNYSGVIYRVVFYGVDRKSEVLDYDEIEQIAKKERPKLIIAGGSSYPRKIDFEAFRRIADSVGAILLVDMAHFSGLVAGKVHPDPVPCADFVSSTTHKTLRGPRGGFVLCKKKFAEALDRAVFPGIQGGPMMHVIAAKATCFSEAMKHEFSDYARAIVENAKALCEKMKSEGMRVVSGGTDTHLFLLDLRPLEISGREAQEALSFAGIDANMNVIPYDEAPATITSGIRIGTPAVTTRGMRPEHMQKLGDIIARVLRNVGNRGALERLRDEVREFASEFPVYPELD